MKLGIVIYSNDSETVWNAFRLGVFSLNKNDEVNAFLIAKGVEAESLDTANFRVTEQMHSFLEAGGKILACGTCLKIRHSGGTEICHLSTMQELHDLITTSDKVISF